MTITENQELIVNIEGKTQCIKKEQIINAFSEAKKICLSSLTDKELKNYIKEGGKLNNLRQEVKDSDFEDMLKTFKLENLKPIAKDMKNDTPKHYDNSNGSLYAFCEKQKLNTWEFDILKRVVRCRKKGNFEEDLEKTKFLIDLYLKEYKKNLREFDITQIIKETPNNLDLGAKVRKIYGS